MSWSPERQFNHRPPLGLPRTAQTLCSLWIFLAMHSGCGSERSPASSAASALFAQHHTDAPQTTEDETALDAQSPAQADAPALKTNLLAGVTYFPQGKLVGVPPRAGEQLGNSVALSGDGSWALLGALSADPGGRADAGAAYVFRRVMGTWTLQQTLIPSDSTAGARFGSSVSLSADGQTALVTAFQDPVGGAAAAGSAYVFVQSMSGFVQQKKLIPSDSTAGIRFGQHGAISADGQTVLIGSNFNSPAGISRAGAAYVFSRGMGAWSEQQKLVASNRSVGSEFGIEVALSGDGNSALVGAYLADVGGLANAGAGYVYRRVSGVWVEQQILTASDRAAGDGLGSSVALSADGRIAALGARSADRMGIADVGAAYVFSQSMTGTWLQQKFMASDGLAGDRFGVRVALSGDGEALLVGADLADLAGLSNAGAAYVFGASATSPVRTQKLVANDPAAGDQLGFGLAMSRDGRTAMLGALNADPTGISNAGGAYVFGPRQNGQLCMTAADCSSGYCVDGICCDGACNQGCQSCRQSGKQDGSADGSCGYRLLGTLCRPAQGSCDVAERCSGTSPSCPPDALVPGMTLCRAAIGVCDASEYCDGRSPLCPVDRLRPFGSICAAAGPDLTCDPADVCDGMRASCAPNYAAAYTPCGVMGAAGQICNGSGRCIRP